MRFLKFFILILIIFNFNLVHAKTKSLDEKITKNLRCLICQGQSVHDSDSEFAISLKTLVKKKLNEGSSCLLYTSPSPRDGLLSRMPSSA